MALVGGALVLSTGRAHSRRLADNQSSQCAARWQLWVEVANEVPGAILIDAGLRAETPYVRAYVTVNRKTRIFLRREGSTTESSSTS